MVRPRSLPCATLLLVALCAACGGGERDVQVQFEAVAGAQPLRCGEAVEGLGTSGSRYELKDLRFYVHDLRLVTAAGEERPVSLTRDGTWQSSEVALLDFEDRTGDCVNGTSETRTVVVGRAPDEPYAGLRFRLGVPASLNHADASTAEAPLNLTTLFWSWRAGYKFLRLDGKTAGLPNGHNFHLGSTGCSGAPTTCDHPNVPELSFQGFDPELHVIRLDVAALFATSDLEQNHEGSPPGCMGAPVQDADCAPLFERLGLAGGAQRAFTAEQRPQ